jgi:hypothetical protein
MGRTFRALALLAFGIALTPAAVYADNAVYSPSTKSIAGTIAFTEIYALDVTSPRDLNNAGDDALPGGITTVLRLSATSWPAGSTQAAAEALVTFSVPTLTYTALSQTRSVNVTFTATASTLPGDYSYIIQADPPNGLGWGVGSHALNVEVSEPTIVDVTPPNVSIVTPVNGTTLVFCPEGVNVPVEVSASDAESIVTSVAADVNGNGIVLTYAPGNNVTATGAFTASAVGVYDVNASATSEGGTGYASQVSVSVLYTTTWLPPLALGKTSKGGSTIPVKLTARDCHGQFVHDESVRILVYEGATLKADAVHGDGAANVRIDDLDGHYITNFQTEAGVHTYTIEVYFNSLLHASKSFSVR